MSKILSGEVDVLDADVTLGAIDWWVNESRQGWQGLATFKPTPGEGELSPGYAFQRTIEEGIAPESAILFGLWGRDESDYQYALEGRGDDVDFVRAWPSVVTSLYAPHDLNMESDANDADEGSMILFCDPVTHLLNNRIWGVFKNRSAGELLAGGLLMSAGVDGAPGLRPVIPGLPDIVIREFVRDVRVPYAIATGEKLGQWLGAIFGRLSIRMELLGARDGTLHVSLRDGEPAGAPVEMSLSRGAGVTSAKIRSFSLGPTTADVNSGTLVDNPTIGEPRRVGGTSTIGRVYSSAGITLDQATRQAARSEESELLPYNTVEISTIQPGFHPGRSVSFDRPLAGARDWQVHEVHHFAEEGFYVNTAKIMKMGVWTPLPPRDRGAIMVSGVVYDPDAGETFGQRVERDELSRVPVRLSFSQGGAGSGGGGGTSIDVDSGGDGSGATEGSGGGPTTGDGAGVEVEQFLAPPPPELMLAVIGPMAGGEHGFVPEHRHGDICEVAVHNPLSAEILGFSYADHLTIGDDMLGATVGWVTAHGEGKWAGMMFLPAEEEEKEKEGED